MCDTRLEEASNCSVVRLRFPVKRTINIIIALFLTARFALFDPLLAPLAHTASGCKSELPLVS